MRILFNKIKQKAKKPLLFAILASTVLLFTVLVSAAVWPEPSGKKNLTGGKLTVDAGNSQLGYIRVMGKKSKKRLKLRVTYKKETLTYDLNSDGEFEVIPLQNGSGSYSVQLYEQSSGQKYAQAGRVTVKAKMKDENAAFLCPNQYVDYDEDSFVVTLSETVCEGLTTETEKFDAICAFVQNNLKYDYMKAVTIKNGQLPDIDKCLKTGMGVCQDLSAVTVAMLRVQGIHARLVIGYADKNYHAWVTATVDGVELFYDPTVALKALKKVKTYTVERIY